MKTAVCIWGTEAVAYHHVCVVWKKNKWSEGTVIQCVQLETDKPVVYTEAAELALNREDGSGVKRSLSYGRRE